MADAGWPADELRRVGRAEELEIATRPAGGAWRDWLPIWVVEADGDLVVRSYRGGGARWFREAVAEGRMRIRAAGVEREVSVERTDAATRAVVDAAYRVKYARYGESYLGPMTSEAVVATTLRLVPLPASGPSASDLPASEH